MYETERLILRKLRDSDARDVFEMRKSEDIMKFIRGPQLDFESSIKWIKMMTEKLEVEKIGFCAVEEKETGAFIGWSGLWEIEETRQVEVGYAIARKFWGRGFATEAARRCLQYGFEELALDLIVAVAYPENIASRRVMEKLGLKYKTTDIFHQKSLVQYAISRKDFKLHK